MKMKNVMRSLFCVLLAVVLSLSVGLFAFAEEYNGFQYTTDSAKKTAQITGYTGSMLKPTNLTIPSEINGFKVNSIKSGAFKGKLNLLTITIPSTVTNLESECFSNCALLNKVSLGTGVSTIGSKAFENCVALTSVDIPAATVSIGAQAFYGCSALKSISVADGNPNYKSVDGVLFNKLGTTLILYPAAKSDKSYTVPGVQTIESYAFYGAKNLTEVTMNDKTTSIGKGAFRDCTSLKKVVMPSKVTKIEDELFMGCNKLSDISFPSGVKTIGENAFSGCSAIPGLNIPDSVTTVGKGAFKNCTGIKKVQLGRGVTAISGAAFSGCSALDEFKVSDTANFTVDKGVLFDKDGKRLVAYPAGSSASEYTVGPKVETIGTNAFDSCKNLKKLTIPKTVKNVDENAVKNCGSLVIYVDAKSAADTSLSKQTKEFSKLQPGSAMLGDVNASGAIDNADAILLTRYTAKWKNVSIHEENADVDANGTIDNADAILLSRYVAGWKNIKLG